MTNIEKKICWFSDKKGSQVFIIVHRATSYIIYTGYDWSKKLCISNDTNVQEDNLSVLSGLRKCVGCKNYILSIIC